MLLKVEMLIDVPGYEAEGIKRTLPWNLLQTAKSITILNSEEMPGEDSQKIQAL